MIKLNNYLIEHIYLSVYNKNIKYINLGDFMEKSDSYKVLIEKEVEKVRRETKPQEDIDYEFEYDETIEDE